MLQRDPDGAMLAFADMMKKQIVMPAHMMNDNQHEGKTGRNLFAVRGAACSQCVVGSPGCAKHTQPPDTAALQLEGEACAGNAS